MSSPVYAPNITTYAASTPYITQAEFKAGATGVDTGQLVPGGTPAQNSDALNQKIAEASSWADEICFQVLAATTDIQSGQYRLQNGLIKVPVDRTPLLEVSAVSVGYSPSTMQAVTDLSNVWLSRKVVQVPIWPLNVAPVVGWVGRPGYVYATVTYVNGYANSTLQQAVAAGDQTFTPASTLGMVPGISLTAYDPGSSEQVTIRSVTGGVVTTTAPFVYAHPVGVSVSAFPASIKQAVILLTAGLIKTRGTKAMVMQSMSRQPTTTTPTQDGGLEDVAVAIDLLANHKRIA